MIVHRPNPEFPTLGVVLPTKEVDLFDLVKTSSSLYDGALNFFILYDHVLLDEPTKESTVPKRLYTSENKFLEPLILAAALSQITKNSQFITGVLVAPQRQTALLAQQAALTSLLSGGRLQLGLGVGWNREEYNALGMDFTSRGKRLDKQIPALRDLWEKSSVTTTIDNEVIDRMALPVKPETRIPIWIGGWAEASVSRAAKHADGWMPMDEVNTFISLHAFMLAELAKHGRTVDKFKTMGRISLGKKSIDECVSDTIKWRKAGITHLALSTTGSHNADIWHHTRLIYQYLQATESMRYRAEEY